MDISIDELPFGLKSLPDVQNTKASAVDVCDHLGESSIYIDTWWSGEGFTIRIDRKGEGKQEIELSWQEWEAVRLSIKAINKS